MKLTEQQQAVVAQNYGIVFSTVFVAVRRYKRPDLEDDFRQVASIAACRAVIDFDSKFGTKPSSLIGVYARNSIREFMRRIFERRAVSTTSLCEIGNTEEGEYDLVDYREPAPEIEVEARDLADAVIQLADSRERFVAHQIMNGVGHREIGIGIGFSRSWGSLHARRLARKAKRKLGFDQWPEGRPVAGKGRLA